MLVAIDGKVLVKAKIKTVREMLVGAPGSCVTLMVQRGKDAGHACNYMSFLCNWMSSLCNCMSFLINFCVLVCHF